jgi:ABC-type branched-subunit amino acid transport system ATPase component
MLDIRHLSKSFGGLKAVDNVSLRLADSPICGLIGPNGSGKTTLFHLITGFYTPDGGGIFFDGAPLHGRTPDAVSRRGLVRTFQHTRVLPQMSVVENLMAAAPRQAGESLFKAVFARVTVRREERRHRAAALGVLETIGLSAMADRPAGEASYGQQKLIELGRVLMAQPRLILLDEPTAGINPTLIRQLAAILRDLSHNGIRIFLIEHNMPLVAELCGHVYVMDSGQLIYEGVPAAVRRNERVIEAYLGRGAADAAAR